VWWLVAWWVGMVAVVVAVAALTAVLVVASRRVGRLLSRRRAP